MGLIAITGTPGTGKSSSGVLLTDRGESVIDLNKTILEYDFILGRDEERDSLDVNIDALSNFAMALEGKDEKNIFLEGHVAHLIPVDIIIILRCHPGVLKERLESRGWSKEKVRENLEAEAMGIISQEAADSGIESYEIDVTDIKVEDIIEIVLDVVAGKGSKDEYGIGKVDFFQEIMKWY